MDYTRSLRRRVQIAVRKFNSWNYCHISLVTPPQFAKDLHRSFTRTKSFVREISNQMSGILNPRVVLRCEFNLLREYESLYIYYNIL